MKNSLDVIINPASIGVIGASDRVGSVGYAVFHNILDGHFKGRLYPVNNKRSKIQNIKAYPSILDIDKEIDLAIIVVPSPMVEKIVDECAAKGVKGIIIISAGFKETGKKGEIREDRIKKTVKDNNIKMLGPNCLGLINTFESISLNASFGAFMPEKGNIAFISQSGALCVAVLDYARGNNIGFSKFISYGNKADVNEIDLLRFLKDDAETKVILMYLENISDSNAFIRICNEIILEKNKPIIAFKSGSSEAGAKAVSSHTGSLAGSDFLYDAIFKQAGVIRAKEIKDLFNNAVAFSYQKSPRNDKIAIVTNAGGPGIIATDAAIKNRLQLAELSEKTKDELRKVLPAQASINNPIDLIGDATHERYKDALDIIMGDDEVGAAIVILTPQYMIDPAKTAMVIPPIVNKYSKPVLCSFMGGKDISEGVRFLIENNIPNYLFPENAVKTISSMCKFNHIGSYLKSNYKQFGVIREDADKIIKDKLRDTDKYFMSPEESEEILKIYGFPLLRSRLVTSRSEIDKAVTYVGFPLVMKISSHDIIHKTDADCVALNVSTLKKAYEVYDNILGNAKAFNPDANVQGVFFQEMAKDGIEVILGGSRDALLGPFCMFGLGGIFVEIFKDISFMSVPLKVSDAEYMVHSTKAYQLLSGARGHKPSDISAIIDCILQLSELMDNHPEIVELDLNPIIVYEDKYGCVVADSRIILSK